MTIPAGGDEPAQVELALKGNELAWEALVRSHQQAAFRLAYLFLGDSDEAEDAAQEAFVRAFRSLHGFDSSRPFRPWLLSIVANQSRNRLRSAGRYLAALRRLVSSEPQAGFAGQHDPEGRWQSSAVWEAIRRLASPDQEIIYLRYFLELSVEETANALSIAEGTVKSRLARALGRLRDVIERDFMELRDTWE